MPDSRLIRLSDRRLCLNCFLSVMAVLLSVCRQFVCFSNLVVCSYYVLLFQRTYLVMLVEVEWSLGQFRVPIPINYKSCVWELD